MREGRRTDWFRVESDLKGVRLRGRPRIEWMDGS